MSVILDDAEDDDNEDRYATLETNAHERWDQDTTLEQLEIYQTERPPGRTDNRFNNGRPRTDRPPSNRPERVFMDNTTWAKITSDDRRSWLRISEPGKLAILEYGSVRKNGFVPGGSKTPGGVPPSHRTTNAHELEFEDTPSVTEQDDRPLIEAKTHERQGPDKDIALGSDKKKPSLKKPAVTFKADDIQGLLHMATHSTDASSGNIAQVLSQQTRANRSVHKHEIMPRSEYTPYECGAHEMYNYLEDDGKPSENTDTDNIVYEVNAHRFLRRSGGTPDPEEDASPTPTVPVTAPPRILPRRFAPTAPTVVDTMAIVPVVTTPYRTFPTRAFPRARPSTVTDATIPNTLPSEPQRVMPQRIFPRNFSVPVPDPVNTVGSADVRVPVRVPIRDRRPGRVPIRVRHNETMDGIMYASASTLFLTIQQTLKSPLMVAHHTSHQIQQWYSCRLKRQEEKPFRQKTLRNKTLNPRSGPTTIG